MALDRLGAGDLLSELPRGPLRWLAFMLSWTSHAASGVQLFKRLRYSNDRQQWVSSRLLFHQDIVDQGGSEREWKLAVLRRGKESAVDWLTILTSVVQLRERIGGQVWCEFAGMDRLPEQGSAWMAQMPVFALDDLRISGKQVIQAGSSAGVEQPGPWIGQVMKALLQQVALGQLPNRQPDLSDAVITWLKEARANDSKRSS